MHLAPLPSLAVVLLCLSLAESTSRLHRLQRPEGGLPRHSGQLPVVLWHGMGDSCCNSWSIGAVRTRIMKALPGVFVHSISTGEGSFADTESTYFGNVNEQVANVCKTLASMPELAGGYNAVGFSQGGQFMRAVAERCQGGGAPRIGTLITMGGQHQGVMNVPECWNPSFNMTPSLVCSAMQRVLGVGAYLPWIREHIVQAQYFKDPYQMEAYLAHSAFLADINNERPVKNETYRANLASVQRLVLYRFKDDVTVVPRDSAWFGFYNGSRLLTMEETQLYQEDWIGLKELNESGRLELKESAGPHMHFTLDWFEENIVRPYLDAGTEVRQQHR